MFKNLKKKLSLIFENRISISHLSLFHFVNIISPLIILPLIINNIETTVLAKIFYFQAIFTFFSVFVNYGFNQYGINLLATLKNPENKTKFFFQISILKLIFFLIIYSMLVLVFYISNNLNSDFIIFLLSGWALCYDIVICDWFYQGIEKVSRINYLNFIFRILNVTMIFFFVSDSSPGFFVPMIYCISMFFVLISNIVFINKELTFIQKKELLNFKDFKIHLIEAFPFFSSNFSSKIYQGSSKIVLGKFGSPIDLIKFEVIDKVLMAMKIPNTILNQVFFPKSSRLFSNKEYVKKLKKTGLIINIPGIILLLVFGDLVFNILTSFKFEYSQTVLYIVFLPIIIFFGHFYGLHQLVPMGSKKKFSTNINKGAFVYILIILIGIKTESITLNLIILSLYATELAITLFMYKGYLVSNKKII